MNKWQKLDLESLLKEVKKRDIDALGELYERFYPKVLKYMYYKARPSDAEDLTAAVFLRVIRSIDSQRRSFEA